MVERYAPDHMMTGSGMTTRRDCGWVRHSDYARLQEQVESLTIQLRVVKLDRDGAVKRMGAAEAERDRLREALRAMLVNPDKASRMQERAALQKEPQP